MRCVVCGRPGCQSFQSRPSDTHISNTQSKYEALGPDPLREDADKERLWAKMQATAKPIGQVLMDQSCVAGIGNIYRAEM